MTMRGKAFRAAMMMMMLSQTAMSSQQRHTERHRDLETKHTQPWAGNEAQVVLDAVGGEGGMALTMAPKAQNVPHTPEEGVTVGAPSPSSSGAECVGAKRARLSALEGVLHALGHAWGGEEGVGMEPGLGTQQLGQFGICPHSGGTSGSWVSALAPLAERAHRHRHGIHAAPLSSELWSTGDDGDIILTLHLQKPLPLHSQPSQTAPMMLLFSVAGVAGERIRMTFSGPSLQPSKQAVCVSDETQFVILPFAPPDPPDLGPLRLSVTVETKRTEAGRGLGLAELKSILMRKAESGAIPRPMVLFLLDSGIDDAIAQPHLPKYGGEFRPLGSFVFLCELQHFLQEVLPRGRPPGAGEGPAAFSMDTLQALPPLSLGAGSSDSLLLGLLNSSGPTLFSFPAQSYALLHHKVELMLEPAHLTLLQLQLDKALAQVGREWVAKGVMDRLQRLRELSTLSTEGEEPTAGSLGSGTVGEAQYRALVLLKALQTVLWVWEDERAKRSARSGPDSTHQPGACRLHSLTVSLEKYLLEPSTATINNCAGSCGFPLSAGTNNHVVLLNSHLQRGEALERTPCCVPLRYADLLVMELSAGGTAISVKTDMVATECGCR